MASFVGKIMVEQQQDPTVFNPMTRMWRQLNDNPLIRKNARVIWLAEIAIVITIGFVEDKRVEIAIVITIGSVEDKKMFQTFLL